STMRQRINGTLIATSVVLGFSACGRSTPSAPTGSRAPLPATIDSMVAGGGVGSGAGSTGEAMPVIVAGGRVADSIAAAPLGLRIGDIGYRDGLTLFGTADETVIAVPVNDGLRPTELRLRVIATPSMPIATLTLRQRDRILALRSVSD